MGSSDNSPCFVFDANFFIALKEVKAIRPYRELAYVQRELKLRFFVTAQIFNECPFIVGEDFREFSDGISIELVKDSELEKIKSDLAKKGIKAIAQDNDLTLIALAARLRNKDNEVNIVSDDYKLSQNVESLQYRIKFRSLPAFLQSIAQNMKGPSRDYFRSLHKRVLKLNLDFMMSRKESYAPQAKIAWLIENAVNVAEEGINLKRNIDPKEQAKQEQNDEHKLLLICEDYITGKPLPADKKAEIASYEQALNGIKESRTLIKKGKEALALQDPKKALSELSKATNSLIRLTQLMGIHMEEDKYQFFEKIMATESCKINFLRAFLMIGANKVPSALEALNQSALFATIARIPETILSINYLIALVYVFNSLYSKAIDQYHFITQLAEAYGQETLKLKAAIGEATTRFMIDQQDEAFELVEMIAEKITPTTLPILMNALIDSGDYSVAMGLPELASNLYSKALECAIDAKQEFKYNLLLNKMKFSYMASALSGNENRQKNDVSKIIEKFHTSSNSDKFNELMEKFALFTNKLYEPFPFFTQGNKGAKYYDLPQMLRESFDCVKIQQIEETERTFMIGYNEEIGLIAFDVQLNRELEGVPENYSLQIKSEAIVKIIPPDTGKENSFLIRAIVVIGDEGRDLIIKKNLPSFFAQMKI